MKYVECPQECLSSHSTFMAGGITGCPDWQADMVQLLADTELALVNPRRKEWPIDRPDASMEQIVWERRHLLRADAILFWFPCETLCPITLFELGAWLYRPKTLFVGTHSDYKRKQDVIIQSQLERPGFQVVHSLNDLASQIMHWLSCSKPRNW